MQVRAIFEAADPRYWCARGYAVVTADPRGAWGSEGVLTLLGERNWWLPRSLGWLPRVEPEQEPVTS